MVGITESMRQAWARYECKKREMVQIPFGPDRILVAPPSVEAWKALERVLQEFDYDIRIEDTDSYNCREIKSGGGRSLHSYGIALDINWHTNPYLDHQGTRPPRFSGKATQRDRGQDVRLGKADTDMTREMIDAALAIRTKGPSPEQVFGWGGRWETIKDSMHFQIQVTPADLERGIDWDTVAGGRPAEDDPISEGDHDYGHNHGGVFVARDDDYGDDDGRWVPDRWNNGAYDGLPVSQPEQVVLREGDSGPMVNALQTGLVALNYHLGAIDGDFGPLTRDALLSFQANNGLPTTGVADGETFALLRTGRPRVLSPKRMAATEADLEEKGSDVINASGWNRWLGIATAALGALGLSDSQMHFVNGIGDALKQAAGATNAVNEADIRAAVEQALAKVGSGASPEALVTATENAVKGLTGAGGADLAQNSGGAFIEPLISRAQGLLSSSGAGPWAMLAGAGLFIWRNSKKAAAARIADHRTGANVNR